MKLKLNLTQKGMLVIAIPCLIQLGFFALNGHLLERTEQLALKEYHNKEVIGHTNWLVTLMSVATLSSFSYALTQDTTYSQIYQWCTGAVPAELDRLAQITNDSKAQEQQIAKMRGTWKGLQGLLDKAVQNPKTFSTDNLCSSSLKSNPKSLGRELFDARQQLLALERSEFVVGPAAVRSARENLSHMVSLGIGLNIVIAFVLFLFFNKGITKRLGILAENSILLARGKEINPPLAGSDEIVQLDRTFHEMAEALTKAHADLKASEQRVLTMIERMPIGLGLISQQGIIEFANPTIEQMFGYEPGTMNGISLSDVVPVSKFSRSEQTTNRRPVELEVTRRNGESFFIDLSLRRLSMKEGEKSLVVMQDVTERHEIERLKNAFVAMVHHDIRTPLNSIRLFHQLIAYTATDVLPVPIRENLEAAERSTNRLLNLVNDLLDMGKLEAGKLKMQFAHTDISVVIEHSVEAVKNFADQHEIKISYPASKIEIVADRERLIQVVVNLLSNAIKFSSDGATVTISVAQENGSLEVRVTDQGRGIPASYRETVFERYSQVQAADGSRERSGTGLGLPICKAIIKEHGGTIGVDSESGKGSSFWFRIPVEQNPSRVEVASRADQI
jgi:PAS domain S-box-containing protein